MAQRTSPTGKVEYIPDNVAQARANNGEDIAMGGQKLTPGGLAAQLTSSPTQLDLFSGIQRPEYESARNSSNGLMADPYLLRGVTPVGYNSVNFDPAKLNTQGLDAVRGRALGTGRTPWASLMLSQQDLEAKMARDRGDQEGASALAQSQSQLAQRGGLSGAAAERLAGNSMKDTAMRRQMDRQADMQKRLGIGLEDERQRTGLLQNLPGMDIAAGQFDMAGRQAKADVDFRNSENTTKTAFQNQANKLQVDQYNINNALKDMTAQNYGQLQGYDAQMKAWAANKQADATAASGDGGSWVCTKISEAVPHTEEEKRCLGKLLRYGLKHHFAPTSFYHREAYPLADRMTESGVVWKERKWFVEDLCHLIQDGDLEAAYKFYEATIMDWVETYWSDCKHPVVLTLRAKRRAQAKEQAPVLCGAV